MTDFQQFSRLSVKLKRLMDRATALHRSFWYTDNLTGDRINPIRWEFAIPRCHIRRLTNMFFQPCALEGGDNATNNNTTGIWVIFGYLSRHGQNFVDNSRGDGKGSERVIDSPRRYFRISMELNAAVACLGSPPKRTRLPLPKILLLENWKPGSYRFIYIASFVSTSIIQISLFRAARPDDTTEWIGQEKRG